MPKKKKYTFIMCKECEIDFLVSDARSRFCPKCGENLFTEKKTTMWIERPFNYKRPWTDEEMDIIRSGLELGRTHKEIASEIDRTPKAVTRQVSEMRKKGLLV